MEKSNRAFHDLITHPLAVLLATDIDEIRKAKKVYRYVSKI